MVTLDPRLQPLIGRNRGITFRDAKLANIIYSCDRHDFLGVYFHLFDLAANEACQICVHARMDVDHLFQCTGLDEYPADDIVSRYWEARRQRVKKPSTGVG
ncbi:reverse transcriptase [Trichonephila clavipes]|nr:reverse transcriptase [Trichonephila clavipes]